MDSPQRPAPQLESELERFFDLTLDLLVLAGFDGYMRRVNPAYQRTLGYPMQELLVRPMLDVVHPDDQQSVGDVLSGLLQGEDVVGFENRVICADGSIRWLQWNTRALVERGLVYGVGRDVTDRRRAEAELRAAHRTIEASRDQLGRLADEQAALRRVATLVAQERPPAEVFAAVAEEVRRVVQVKDTRIVRYEPDGTVAVVASAGRPAGDISSAAGTPIIVQGRRWGAVLAASRTGDPLSPEAEARTTRSGSTCATTGSAAPGLTAAGSSGSATGSPPSAVASASTARPAEARWSLPSSRSRPPRAEAVVHTLETGRSGRERTIGAHGHEQGGQLGAGATAGQAPIASCARHGAGAWGRRRSFGRRDRSRLELLAARRLPGPGGRVVAGRRPAERAGADRGGPRAQRPSEPRGDRARGGDAGGVQPLLRGPRRRARVDRRGGDQRRAGRPQPRCAALGRP
jgi:PAS domain S-box-containing protein